MQTDKNYGVGSPPALKGGGKKITLNNIISVIDKKNREILAAGYDFIALAKIFEDNELMAAVDCFLENGMNASHTARKLYMHRNTLAYRLGKIYELSGLDLRSFDDAVTFKILHALYGAR